MQRRTWVLLAGIALAAAAVVGGSFVAIGLGDDASSAPAGEANVLRIGPVSEEVACGAPAAVYIYLDDVVSRPSPRQEGVSYGVASFQFLLRYDPAIVRIAAPLDVQLNAQLDTEDADGDGIGRSWLLADDIDDYAGEALLGGVSLVPGSGGGDENFEEGLDPVAKGEPLLLMTVRFTPVGQGTTTLTLDATGVERQEVDPLLLDPGGALYEPLVLKDASLTVRGGDCPEPPPATPRPTPVPNLPPPTRALPTPVPWRTVTPQDAASSGRPDCPTDWVVYHDSRDRFSICYPPDFGATASDLAVNIRTPALAAQSGDSFSVAVSWNSTPRSAYYPPSSESCPKYPIMGRTASEFVELSLSGLTVPVCLNRGLLEGIPAVPVANLLGAIPLALDGSERHGYILFSLGFSGPDISQVPQLGQSILETLALNFR